jgi:hypothetical protein
MTGSMSSRSGGNSGGSIGGSGAGMNSSVAGGGFLQTTQLGQMASFNNQGFIGANNGGFIGRSATANGANGQRGNRLQGQFQRRNNGGRNGRNGRNGNNSDNDNDNPGSSSRNSALSRNSVRAQHKVAFDYPQPVSTAVGTTLASRFKSTVQARPDLANLDVAFDENLGQVTLRGAVKSNEAAQVAVALVRLEPGVRSVKSELTVTPEVPQPPAPGVR